jgi:hypothetical protein
MPCLPPCSSSTISLTSSPNCNQTLLIATKSIAFPSPMKQSCSENCCAAFLDMSKFPTELIKSYAACTAPISDIVEEDAPEEEQEPAACPLEEFRPYVYEERQELDGFSRNELISFGRDYIGMLKKAKEGGYSNDDDPSLDKYKNPALAKERMQENAASRRPALI